MAASQPNKPKKVRPVMDYRKELNYYISSNPGCDAVVSQDKLRKWCALGNEACILDLKKAYLEFHIDKDPQQFQTVRFRGKLHVMTRMGFGLNVAPKIMSAMLASVLALDPTIAEGTDNYIDDIWVNEHVVSVETVKKHLLKYGLVTKDPEPLDDARVLGLRVTHRDDGTFTWTRDGSLPAVPDSITTRELYSICGKLVGHSLPSSRLVVSCLRVYEACS